MARYEFRTQLAPFILEHWRTHHDPDGPSRFQALVKARVAEKMADQAAEDAIALVTQAMSKHGMSYAKAEKMAFVEWNHPPVPPQRNLQLVNAKEAKR